MIIKNKTFNCLITNVGKSYSRLLIRYNDNGNVYGSLLDNKIFKLSDINDLISMLEKIKILNILK